MVKYGKVYTFCADTWEFVERGNMSKIGAKESTLDEKGRLMVPQCFREQYQGSIVITNGVPPCLVLMKEDVYAKLESEIKGPNSLNSKEQAFMESRFTSPAEYIEIDGTGRIQVPLTLRVTGNLNNDAKETFFMESSYGLEIWNKKIYVNYLTNSNTDYDSGMEKLDLSSIRQNRS